MKKKVQNNKKINKNHSERHLKCKMQIIELEKVFTLICKKQRVTASITQNLVKIKRGKQCNLKLARDIHRWQSKWTIK